MGRNAAFDTTLSAPITGITDLSFAGVSLTEREDCGLALALFASPKSGKKST